MSRYEDRGVEQDMRESAERFERILRETRAIGLPPRADRAEFEAEREARRAELREFWARLDRFQTGGESA